MVQAFDLSYMPADVFRVMGTGTQMLGGYIAQPFSAVVFMGGRLDIEVNDLAAEIGVRAQSGVALPGALAPAVGALAPAFRRPRCVRPPGFRWVLWRQLDRGALPLPDQRIGFRRGNRDEVGGSRIELCVWSTGFRYICSNHADRPAGLTLRLLPATFAECSLNPVYQHPG
jgi:hypothetical protein